MNWTRRALSTVKTTIDSVLEIDDEEEEEDIHEEPSTYDQPVNSFPNGSKERWIWDEPSQTESVVVSEPNPIRDSHSPSDGGIVLESLVSDNHQNHFTDDEAASKNSDGKKTPSPNGKGDLAQQLLQMEHEFHKNADVDTVSSSDYVVLKDVDTETVASERHSVLSKLPHISGDPEEVARKLQSNNEYLQSRVNDLSATNSSLLNQVALLKKQNTALNSELNNTKHKLNEKSTEYEDLVEEGKRLSKKLHDFTVEAKKLQKTNAELVEQAETAKVTEGEKQSMENQIQKLEAMVETLTKDRDRISLEFDSVNDELNRLNSEKEYCDTQYNDVVNTSKETVEKLQIQVQELESKLAHITDMNNRYKSSFEQQSIKMKAAHLEKENALHEYTRIKGLADLYKKRFEENELVVQDLMLKLRNDAVKISDAINPIFQKLHHLHEDLRRSINESMILKQTCIEFFGKASKEFAVRCEYIRHLVYKSIEIEHHNFKTMCTKDQVDEYTAKIATVQESLDAAVQTIVSLKSTNSNLTNKISELLAEKASFETRLAEFGNELHSQNVRIGQLTRQEQQQQKEEIKITRAESVAESLDQFEYRSEKVYGLMAEVSMWKKNCERNDNLISELRGELEACRTELKLSVEKASAAYEEMQQKYDEALCGYGRTLEENSELQHSLEVARDLIHMQAEMIAKNSEEGD